MADALGFILNAAGLFVPLGLDAKYAMETPKQATSVQFIAGGIDPNNPSDKNASPGGNVPHVALWDDNGHRIGQFHPGSKDKIGDSNVLTIAVEHSQTEPPNSQADPYYVMVTNLENDAICLAAITVANEKISGTFYGDTGYTCGQSWFLSKNKIGSNFQTPKCVWLDADHTNKINARALSFHLNDMAPNTDKLAEYQDNQDTLCKSTPRFSFWGNLLPDGIIPFFSPPLKYNTDSSGTGEGSDVDTKAVIDKPNQYNKGVYLHQGEKQKRDKTSLRRRADPVGWNHNPTHLIATDYEDHDVRELCEHPNSYGYDIYSTRQNVFCDMETKQLYPLCSDSIKDDCFDTNKKVIVPKGGLGARELTASHIPQKSYLTHDVWS